MIVDIRTSPLWGKSTVSAKIYKNLAWWGWHINTLGEISVEHYCRPESSFMWSAVVDSECVRCSYPLEDKIRGLEAQYISATYCHCSDPHEQGEVEVDGRIYSYVKADHGYIVKHSDNNSGTHTTAILDNDRVPLLKVKDKYCHICKDHVATTDNLEFIILKTKLGVKPNEHQ